MRRWTASCRVLENPGDPAGLLFKRWLGGSPDPENPILWVRRASPDRRFGQARFRTAV